MKPQEGATAAARVWAIMNAASTKADGRQLNTSVACCLGSYQPQRRAEAQDGRRFGNYLKLTRVPACLLIGCALASLLVAGHLAAAGETRDEQSQTKRIQDYFEQLKRRDTCGTIYTSELHKYQVLEYKVRLQNGYQIALHRLIHPEDYLSDELGNGIEDLERLEPLLRAKKSYLLMHGLIGSSASFVLNVADDYKAPPKTYRANEQIVQQLKSRAGTFQHEWQSTADRLRRSNSAKGNDNKAKSLSRSSTTGADLASVNEPVFDSDKTNFGPEFRQAYRKFALPQEAHAYTTNSLAFTLSNFGYDVWLINLRGNEYSKQFEGPLTSSHDEFWDFDIGTLVKQDLMGAIEYIQLVKGTSEPIGLISYSYSAAQVLNLLTSATKFALGRLQPIVMLAPTLMTGAHDRKQSSRLALKLFDLKLGKTGPFPAVLKGRGQQRRGLDQKLVHLVCKLPVASQLCRFMESVMLGESKQVSSVRGLILPADRRALALRQRSDDCGRTSKRILHQIIDNIKRENIPAEFRAFDSVRRFPVERRPVILVHAQEDEISTMAEVERIKSSALKTLTLLDYVIKTPRFSHSDFLFSRQNQFLVNAEVLRQVLVFDYLENQPNANRQKEVPVGI